MIVLIDKLGFRSRPFRMFRSDFMYTIGQVSQMCGIPVSTLRYYDKEGLFPHMERVSGIRRFSDRELETLRIIDCLKKSGLEIREIRKFMQWCAEGSSSYPQRRELFENQKKTVEKKLSVFKRRLICSALSAGTTILPLLTETRTESTKCSRTIFPRIFKSCMTMPTAMTKINFDNL